MKNNTNKQRKITALHLFAVSLIGIVLLFSVMFSNAVAKKKSILDYYLALPDEYFVCEMNNKITRQYRLKQIVKKNIRSGYIEAKSEGFPMQVALFIDNNRKITVVVVNIACGTGCMCNRFEILAPLPGGKWKNVTDEHFPGENKISNAINNKDIPIEYILPEFGTTIKAVHSETRKRLFNLQWKDGRFIISVH